MKCGYRLFTVLLILLAGCKFGPNYKRPKPWTVPPYTARTAQSRPQGVSIAEEKWWTVFQDAELQKLIRTALAENYDVRIAATRILQAQAALGITRADQFPTITAGASAASQRVPETIVGPAANTSPSEASLSLFWELDFWGKFRRATEAARANLLATEWGQRAVITSLVSNVASAYYQLRELDLEMEISRQTLASRQESLRLVKVRQQGGVTSMMDVRQSEQLVYFAAASIPDLERRIEQQENFISSFWEKIQGRLPVASRWLRTCCAADGACSDCLPHCWSGGQTFNRSSNFWWRPMLVSVWPKPHIFRRSRLPPQEATRVRP